MYIICLFMHVVKVVLKEFEYTRQPVDIKLIIVDLRCNKCPN